MREIVEVYLHWQAGRSIKAIARSLGMDRKTVRKYVGAAVQAGLHPGEQRSDQEWAALVQKWFPRLVDRRRRSSCFGELEQHREFIREGLKTNRMSTVHRRLVERAGLAVSVATFRRYVHSQMPDLLEVAPVTVWRPEVLPGEEAQVDFGYLGRWQDLTTGRCHRVYAFVLVLSYSRHMFVRPVLRLDRPTWLECHVDAFASLESVPQRVVIDNLKDGVTKPDLYDPALNRAYSELATHYGFLIDPARQGHPKDKPRVERPLSYIRDSFWRGEQFLSLEAMRQRAVNWSAEVAGLRIHGTTQRKPLEVFQQEERSAMLPLPERPFEHCIWTTAKVGPDAHCSVAGTLYSVPHVLRGRRLDVRLTDRLVQFYEAESLVKMHLRRPNRGRTTDPGDLPPDRIAFYERTPRWCIHQATAMGPSVLEAVQQVLAVQTLTHLRQAQGIIRLERTYGKARLEAACSRALAFGDPAYRTVKQILASGLDARLLSVSGGCAGTSAYLRGTETFALDIIRR
ncbi:MAG TPA: IS21 family transposase [Dissulfurispiraceae bacterium]|nr:IS21 family transposase [Dissulfurispiraceae bacterium]